MEEISPVGALGAHLDERDGLLSGSVSGHLAAALRRGRPVLAIATAPRRRSLAERLGAEGIVVERAIRGGQLVLLDAAETLERLISDGRPRWDRFRAVVGGALSALERRRAGEPCAYGELHADAIRRVLGAHGRVFPAESRSLADPRLREVVRLQERVRALEAELDRRRPMESALRDALAESLRLQEQTRQRNEELARAVRLAESFVGMLGHDLRNPLNAISQAAGLVARRAESDAVAKHAMRIGRSARRMARMIDQILDLTRIRLGRGLPLEPRPLDLAEVCRIAAEELEGEADTPRVRLEARGDVAGTWDADRLAQLASNLVGNALAHGKPGAPVSIVLDGTSRGEVVLEVVNAGSIPADLLPGIFEPFTASRDAAGATSHGLGLGLHITRQIAMAHGGSVDVASSEEGWTRFTVRLPRSPPPKA